MSQIGQNRAQNKVFCHFLKFSSLVFLEIAYNDSLQQCLTSSTDKIYEKFFWAQICTKGDKIGSETRFFYHFLKFGSLDFLEIACNNSLQQCLISGRGTTHEKIFLGPTFGQIGPESRFFTIFSSLVH